MNVQRMSRSRHRHSSKRCRVHKMSRRRHSSKRPSWPGARRSRTSRRGGMRYRSAVSQEVLRKLKSEKKLKTMTVNNILEIHEIYHSYSKSDHDPPARDVVDALVSAAREKNNITVSVNDASHDQGVWLPFLNRDIYTGFQPELDKVALVQEINRSEFDENWDEYCKKLLQGTKMGAAVIPLDLKDFLSDYEMHLLGPKRERTLLLREDLEAR